MRAQGAVATVVGPTRAIVPAVGDIFSAARAPLAHYIWKHGSSDFSDVRRIIRYDELTGEIEVNRDITLVANDVVSVYQVLTPEDWNNAIRDGLAGEYFIDRYSVTLVSAQTEYTLPTWIQVPMQVEDVRMRYVSTADVVEESAPGYSLVNATNAVTLNLHHIPADLTGKTAIVVARRYYAELASDAATTTCPTPLAMATTKVEALRLAWRLLGDEQAKKLFGQEMSDALSDLQKARSRWVPRVSRSSLSLDSRFQGPDFAVKIGEWPW